MAKQVRKKAFASPKEVEARRFRPIRKIIKTRKGKDMLVKYNEVGRRVLLDNRELFGVMREMAKKSRVELGTIGADGKPFNLRFSTMRGKEKAAQIQRVGLDVFRITLKGGREFALKFEKTLEPERRLDLEGSYYIKKDGKKAVDCYLQFHIPKTDCFFVLMESIKLPGLSVLLKKMDNKIMETLFQGAHKKNKKLRKLKKKLMENWEKTRSELQEKGFYQVEDYNVFVRTLPGGEFEFVHFDVGLKRSKFPKETEKYAQ